MIRPRAAALLAAASFLLAVPPPQAHAGEPSVAAAVAALRSADLYVDTTAEQRVTVRSAQVTPVLGNGTKVAVLPSSAGKAVALAGEIGPELDPDGTTVVIGVLTVSDSGQTEFRGLSGLTNTRFCKGFVDEQAKAALSEHKDDLRADNDITSTLVDFAGRIAKGPSATECPTDTTGSVSSPKDDGGNAWPWLVGAGVLGAGAVGAVAFTARRRRAAHSTAEASAADDLLALEEWDDDGGR